MELNHILDISQFYPSKKNKLVYFLLIIVFSLTPVYIFQSGGLQLVDIPILLIVAYILLTINSYEIQIMSFLLIAFFSFVIWAICVNVFQHMATYNFFYIQVSLQLLYVAMLFFTFTILFFRILNEKRIIPYIYTGILLSTISSLLIKGLPGFDLSIRHTLSFNNPNQLALFSLIVMAMIMILNNYFKNMSKTNIEKFFILYVNIIVFVLVHYFILVSASRAGMISLLLLDIIFFIKIKNKALLLIPMIILIIFIASTFFPKNFMSQDTVLESQINKRLFESDYHEKLANRTERINMNKLNISEIIVGSGKSTIGDGEKEVHNTFVDILYSYGLIGGCIFSIFLLLYFKKCGYFHIIILMAFLPMHISHNLLRFRMFWILLALIYGISLIRSKRAQIEHTS